MRRRRGRRAEERLEGVSMSAGEDESDGNPNKMKTIIFLFFKRDIHLTIVVKSYTLTILFKIFFV